MEKVKPQSFEKHARLVPVFHFFVLPVLMINLVWSLVDLKNGITAGSVRNLAVAAALMVLAVIARVFALSVQDRVIRMEMQLRLERMLPAELRPRIGEFAVEQLIGLRFAGDEELPGLARQVLDEKLADRKTIKRRVKNWKPDYLRA